MNEFFEKNHINPKTYGITEDYTILKEFIKAEALTFYPDFRTRADIDAEVPLEEGQIEGCIEFRRQYNTISNSIDDVKAGNDVANIILHHIGCTFPEDTKIEFEH